MEIRSKAPSRAARVSISILAIFMVLALAACSGGGDEGADQEQAATGDAATTAAAEQERAVDVVSARLAKLRQDVTALEQQAGDEEVDASQITALSGRLAEADRGIQNLQGASLDSWQNAKTTAEGTLDGLERSYSQVSSDVNGEIARVQAERREREEKRAQEMLATGLVMGLDGEPYAVPGKGTLEKVQKTMKDRGLFRGEVSGHLSERTMTAVAAFQEQNGLAVTGVPAPYTRSVLYAPPEG